MKIAVSDTGKEVKQKLYMDWLKAANPQAELVVASYNNNFAGLDGFDGLVLTGGQDVDPALSNAKPVELVETFDRLRDDFEFRLLEQGLKKKMPVFGICRGMQVTNVFLGGTLIADLKTAGFQEHTARNNGPELRHAIHINDGTMLGKITGTTVGEINSFHHQSVLNVAKELIPSGYSDDNVIESLEWKDKRDRSFLLLVQWHPERMKENENPFTSNIVSAFFTEAQKFNSMK